MFGRDVQRCRITRREQSVLARSASAPHRPDRMDDVPGREPISARDFGIAGRTAMERAAFGKELRPGAPMNRTIDAAASEQ